MLKTSLQTINQFKEVLLKLPNDCYTKSCKPLSGATIGQHTRHIIELYQCLLTGYGSAEVSYDKRKRNKKIEQEVNFAIHQLALIQEAIEQPNKPLIVSYILNENNVCFESNYFREAMYNLEHTIHHQALIKVAINVFTDILLPEDFGVAPSTMQHRKQYVK